MVPKAKANILILNKAVFKCFCNFVKISLMNLIIDIGNSSIKLFIFVNSKIIFHEKIIENNFIESLKAIHNNYVILNIICSSVTKNYDNVLYKIFKNLNIYKLSDKKLKLPFQNNYKSTESLGQDRIGLVTAAILEYPDQNNLIIDLGTCITYDFVDFERIYHGGAISPGLKTRYQSIKENTSKLPLLEFKKINKIIGSTTDDSIHIGISNGIIGEIKEYIRCLSKSYLNFNVIITGGDSTFLRNKIKNAIFANQNFIAKGLNYIIKHNEANNK